MKFISTAAIAIASLAYFSPALAQNGAAGLEPSAAQSSVAPSAALSVPLLARRRRHGRRHFRG